MARIICHKDGKYNFFCTQWDDFVFEKALTLDELKEYTLKKKGEDGLEKLEERLVRAHAKGTSSHYGESLEDEIWLNRAGENESRLSVEECIRRYLS